MRGRVGRGPERFFMAIGPHDIKRLTIRGVVQKIGFRVWTERKALRLGLDGWVRNRLDGSVEVLVAGPPPAVAELIEQCRNGPPLPRLDSGAIQAAPALHLRIPPPADASPP